MLGPLPAAHRAALLVASAAVGIVTGLWMAVVSAVGAFASAGPVPAALVGGIAIGLLGMLALARPSRRGGA